MFFDSPADLPAAETVVQSLVLNLNRNQGPVRASIPAWDQVGCHYFAQAAKGCHHYSAGHLLGQALRNLANRAIMREHKLANAND